MSPESSASPLVPIAIVVGFTIIALAVFFTGSQTSETAPTASQSAAAVEAAVSPIRPVDETDYVRGNPNAPIVIIEYSDYECPFCKQYHTVMRQIMSEYGASGRVAWVYRQYPIPQLHPNSPKISEAAMCVGSQAGQDAFWTFSDTVFDSRGLRDVVNMTKLADFAEAAGADRVAFTRCYEGGEMQATVEAQMREAFDAGIRVTPYTVIMVGTDMEVVEGTISYDELKGIIEDVFAQLDGEAPATTTPTSAL